MNGISAAILAGGLGTRLRSVVSDRPKVLAPVAGRPFLTHLLDQLAGAEKVLAPVAGRPFLTHLLDQLAGAGIREVTLLTGFAADQIHDEFGEQYRDIRLNHSREPEPLGTGGALGLALPRLTRSSVLLLNGDSYCDVDMAGLVDGHRRSGALATLTLAEVPDCSRYGRVVQNADGHIERFEEKGGSAEPGWINAGVYVFERELIEAIPAGRSVSLEREVLPDAVKCGRVTGYPGGRFIDIGTPESFAAADRFFQQ